MSREATKVAPNDECETRLSSQSQISEIYEKLLALTFVSKFKTT